MSGHLQRKRIVLQSLSAIILELLIGERWKFDNLDAKKKNAQNRELVDKLGSPNLVLLAFPCCTFVKLVHLVLSLN